MLFRLIRDGENIQFQGFLQRSASELGLAEKDLENRLSKSRLCCFAVRRYW